MKTKDIVNISLFTTLLAVCAWIYIPTTIPFTMQTFAVFLTMLMLGGRKGTIVILIYLLLGLIGVPVFSGGTAGPGILLGATGGYMIGWLLLGAIMELLEKIFRREKQETGETKKAKKFPKTCIQIAGLIVGLLICYLFGTLWFVKVYAGQSMNTGVAAAFSVCVLPFIIPDLVKLALAYTVSRRMKKIGIITDSYERIYDKIERQ